MSPIALGRQEGQVTAMTFHSNQHRQRLGYQWRIEVAYTRALAALWQTLAEADRALKAEYRSIRESEAGQEMTGGTGGPTPTPPDPWADGDGNGFRTETCSVCDGGGEIWTEDMGERGPTLCHGCGGVGKITYRSAAGRQQAAEDAALLAQHDHTLELVKRQRAHMIARDVASLPPDVEARIRGMRVDYVTGIRWNGTEDR